VPHPEVVDAHDLLHRCKKARGAAMRNPGSFLIGHADYADYADSMGFFGGGDRTLITMISRALRWNALQVSPKGITHTTNCDA